MLIKLFVTLINGHRGVSSPAKISFVELERDVYLDALSVELAQQMCWRLIMRVIWWHNYVELYLQ